MLQRILSLLRNGRARTSSHMINTDEGICFGWGTTVGNGIEGWAPNAAFVHTDGSTNARQYKNVGTSTTASWLLVGSYLDSEYVTFGTGSDVPLGWNGTYLQGGSSTMWANAPSKADARFECIAHEYFDDFLDDASHAYTETDDGGTGAWTLSTDAAGGVATIATAAADNDHHAISPDAEQWLFTSGKKLWIEARVKLTEATTNESAIWFGLTDTLTTGGIQADAVGPLASYDGALIWKDEASLTWDFETSNAATQKTADEIGTYTSGAWTTLGFYFDGTATTATVTPYIDGTAGTAKTITLAGLQEMHMVLGVKAGPTAAAETLHVDYIRCLQLR